MGFAPPTERGLQSVVVQALNCWGIPATGTDASLSFGPDGKPRRRKVTYTGWPDISAVLPGGRFLGIELKSEHGRLRPEQTVTLARLRKQGALAFVARSLAEVREALEREGYL